MKDKGNRADILQAIREVPLISTAAAKLLEITSDPDHNLADIVKVITYDAALTSHVLKVVNSAAFARQATISSIDRAVSLLGGDMVVGIAMSDAATHLFNRDLDGYAGERGDLWRHDLLVAIAARKIVRHSKDKVSGDIAFTCGLLHDLGKAIISDFLRGTHREIPAMIEQGKIKDYLAAEQDIVGVDHATVGFELANYWKLPEPLPSVIRHHHFPGLAAPEIKSLVYTVHLGDIVAMMAGCGTGADTLFYSLDAGYPEFIDLTGDDLSRVVLEVGNEFSQIEASLAG